MLNSRKRSNTGYKGISITVQSNRDNIILRLVIANKVIKSIMIGNNKNYVGSLDHTTFKNAMRILLDIRASLLTDSDVADVDYTKGIEYIKEHKLNVLGVELDEPETLGDIIKDHIVGKETSVPDGIDDKVTDEIVPKSSMTYISSIENIEAELAMINARKIELENELNNRKNNIVNDTIALLARVEDNRNTQIAICSDIMETLLEEYTKLISTLKEENDVCESSLNTLTKSEDVFKLRATIKTNKDAILGIDPFINHGGKVNDYYNRVSKIVHDEMSGEQSEDNESSALANTDLTHMQDMVKNLNDLDVSELYGMLGRLFDKQLELSSEISKTDAPGLLPGMLDTVKNRILEISKALDNIYAKQRVNGVNYKSFTQDDMMVSPIGLTLDELYKLLDRLVKKLLITPENERSILIKRIRAVQNRMALMISDNMTKHNKKEWE